MYKVSVAADSISVYTHHRLTSLLLTFPRIILPELNTHRVFSRNSASNRAIPTSKLIDKLNENYYIPQWFNKSPGMKTDPSKDIGLFLTEVADNIYDRLYKHALLAVTELDKQGLTKSSVNRLLEPYMFTTVLVSSTEWSNFLDLRLNENADIPMQTIAYLICKALIESRPSMLDRNQVHLPVFGRNTETYLDERETAKYINNELRNGTLCLTPDIVNDLPDRLVSSIARIARLSYLNHNKQIDLEADRLLVASLLRNRHMSPFEHIAIPTSNNQSVNYPTANFRGFIPLRSFISDQANDQQDIHLIMERFKKKSAIQMETIRNEIRRFGGTDRIDYFLEDENPDTV